MESKARRKSDALCDKILSGIRFSPVCPQSDLRTNGIHRTQGGGGLGYSYWRSPKVMELHKNVRAYREVTKTNLSYVEVQEAVAGFLEAQINPFIAGRFDLQMGNGSLIDKMDKNGIEGARKQFFEHLSRYVADKWYWAPLNTVHSSGFRGRNFHILSEPDDSRVDERQLAEFLRAPTFSTASSYLGVRARNLTSAYEKSSTVLGAIMLCMHTGTNFSHTLGKTTSGFLNFDHGLTYSSWSQHIPYLSTPISLEEADKAWLSVVDSFLTDEEKHKKIIRALRWFRASWFLKGAERFSTICQAIDAVTPSKLNTMKAKCGWIGEYLNPKIDATATELLFKNLRSDVAHGDAPSLVESNSYLEFLERYGVEPLDAVFEISRQLVWKNFIPDLIIRPHPITKYPDVLDKMNMELSRYDMKFNPPIGYDFSRLSQQSES